MSILLTGVTGQVGGDILPLLKGFGNVYAPTREEMDLSSASSVAEYVRRVQPQWIINPAAYTAVDKAETDSDLAYAVNAVAPAVLAAEAARIGAVLLHFSTDYVFDGSGTKARSEEDPTGPLSVYGSSKLAGENAILATEAVSLIFRTSWVYGTRGKNFLRTILKLAHERDELKIVADQYGSPTWSHDLACLVVHVVDRAESESRRTGRPVSEIVRGFAGLYHASGSGDTTWFGFAEEALRIIQAKEPDVKLANLVPIASSEYPTPAKRPANSKMNCDRLQSQLDFTFPSWKESLVKMLNKGFND